MKFETFIDLLKRELNDLSINDKVIGGDENNTLNASAWTYLFHIGLYLTIKKINKNGLQFIIYTEKGGRYPTDFLIRSSNSLKW